MQAIHVHTCMLGCVIGACVLAITPPPPPHTHTCVFPVQEKRYEEACAKFNTVLQVMGYRAGMYDLYTHCVPQF